MEIKLKVASEVSGPAILKIQDMWCNQYCLTQFRETNKSNNEIVMGNSNINILTNADDIAILGDTVETIKQVCRKLMMARKIGYDEKTEYKMISRQGREY